MLNGTRRLPLSAALALSVSTCILAAPAMAQTMHHFDVPAQSTADALNDVSRQAGIQIFFPTAKIAGRTSAALKGAMGYRQAIDRLLAGSGLSVASDDGKIVVLRQSPAPTPDNATISAAQPDGGKQNGEIVVTGSRLATRLGEQGPAPVTTIGSEEYRLSGTQNAEALLTDMPQFIGAQNSGATGNNVPGGNALLNLRGLGAQRSLVLVNGRRYTITGPSQATDINSIPTALIKRVEVVTGGSSAVYGSDAIAGVVNFVLKDDFQGFEIDGQNSVDQHTGTPTSTIDVTAGRNFADGRGNITASFDYLDRRGITARDRGGWAAERVADGCVTADSFSKSRPGTPLAVPSGSSCLAAGGRPGLVTTGSGSLLDGRFAGIPTVGSSTSTPGLNAALTAAGLGSIGSRGLTFNDAGTVARPALTPQDDFNLLPDSYLIVPQKRVMGNIFAHYDLSDHAQLYTELHYSRNKVDIQLTSSDASGNYLFNVDNPYLSPALQAVLKQLDLAEPASSSFTTGATTQTTTRGDGLAILNIGRRLGEVGHRTADYDTNAYRGLFGVKGDIGDLSSGFLRDLKYDVYYSYARTNEHDVEQGAISVSKLQAALLSQNGAAPIADIFGANLSAAAVKAISVTLHNSTQASQQVANANLTGELFAMPAGPVDFSVGVEWRREWANYAPDAQSASGDISGYGASLPTHGEESAKEAYGEVRVPLLADLPLIRHLDLTGAFRYSKYDLNGVGGVWTYSGGARYEPVRGVALRGQYQRAIRAPNVGELFGGSSTSGPSLVDPCSSRQPTALQTDAVRAVCVATGVPAALVFGQNVQPNQFITVVSGGNASIGPETSDTKTAGITLAPVFLPGFHMSADWYDIDVKGAISTLGGGASNILNLCYNIVQNAGSPFCQAIGRDSVSGQITAPKYISSLNANTGAIKTSGVDFEAGYSFAAGFGFGGESRFDLSTDINWTDQFTSTPVSALPTLKNRCAGSFGQTCGQPIPHWKGVTRLTWESGPLTLSLRHRFIGAVTVDTYMLPKTSGGTVPSLASLTNPVIPTQNYFDLTAEIAIQHRMTLTLGVTNIADRDPPVIGTPSPTANTFSSTYDILGRTLFVAARTSF
ncbi:TonB-dependent receptor [Sphingomonas abietis]|uniref:TonB-dependent receptor n=1 Tax=Sphingomonas abietis TaxID=3012344 RepID=A0ABY7NN20_9SPHN|nr:TonB-dependent receptor [Sphingomonas abietis]WBO22913.1 TonB-dependent receptor [Sphingomonas abietis]